MFYLINNVELVSSNFDDNIGYRLINKESKIYSLLIYLYFSRFKADIISRGTVFSYIYVYGKKRNII